ncbi:MAG: AsmA family protein [Pseudomonadota bacterium]
MPTTSKTVSKRRYMQKFLIWLLVTVTAAASLMIGSVFLLPGFVSADRFKKLLEDRASKALDRPVQIERLKWKWTSGVVMEGIKIKDDPEFSDGLLFYIEKVRMTVSVNKILDRRLSLDCNAYGLDARLIRKENGDTNLDSLLSQRKKTATEEPLPGLDKLSFSIPGDINAGIHLKKVSLRLEDRMLGKRFALQDADIRLDMPSLYFHPITLNVSSDVTLDDQEPHPFRLKLFVKDLVNDNGLLQLNKAYIEMNGTLPGVRCAIAGDLARREFNSDINVDLRELTKIIHAYQPSLVAGATVNGSLTFLIKASGNPLQALSFNTSLEGINIDLSGNPAQNRRVGPIDFSMFSKGTVDVSSGTLSIESGGLHFLENSSLFWKGAATGINGPKPKIDLNVGPMVFDLGEIMNPAYGFIPEDFPLNSNTMKGSPLLRIKGVDFSGDIPSGSGSIELKDLVLVIPNLEFSAGGSTASVADLWLSVPDIRSSLTGFFPKQIELISSLKIAGLRVKGDSGITVEKIEIPRLAVIANEIRKSETAILGVTSTFSIHESLTADKITVPFFLTGKGIKQSMGVDGTLRPDRGAELFINGLTLSVPDLMIENRKYGSFNTNVEMSSSASGIELRSIEPLNAGIKDLNATIAVDDVLRADLSAKAADPASSLLNAGGKIEVDLGKLSDKVLSKIFGNQNLVGKADIQWSVSGRFPGEGETEKLRSLSSVNPKNDFAFLDRMDISFKLKDLDADVTLAQKERLKFGRLSTGLPLKYTFSGKTGKGELSGSLFFSDVKAVYYTVFKKPLEADLAFSGKHDGLNSFEFSQTMAIRPLNVKQELLVSLFGMDRILQGDLKTDLPVLIRNLGGKMRATVNVMDGADSTVLTDRLDINGNLEAGAEMRVVPGQLILAKTWVYTPQMKVRLKDVLDIEGLQIQFDLDKNYRIVRQGGDDINESQAVPLSVGILRSNPVTASVREDKIDEAQQFLEVIRKQFNRPHTVSCESARINTGSVSLIIDRPVIDFDVDRGLPRSNYFQVNLLGGTAIGSFSVLEKGGNFYLQGRLSFSGLDTGKIFPEAALPADPEDTELSGELSVFLPLSAELTPLLQELKFDLVFSDIGSRSLERLLYALDPYENNEAIVSQRRLLRTGSPRRIRAVVRDGSLSLSGVAEIKGVLMDLPRVDRLNIAGVPGLGKYETYLDVIDPVIAVLKISSATGLRLDEASRIFHGD